MKGPNERTRIRERCVAIDLTEKEKKGKQQNERKKEYLVSNAPFLKEETDFFQLYGHVAFL
jgi:hypothetical protein